MVAPQSLQIGIAWSVEALLDLLAGPEKRHPFLLHEHRRAGPWIASGSGGSMLDEESAKTSQFHAISLLERDGDFLKDGVNDTFGVQAVEMRVPSCDDIDKL